MGHLYPLRAGRRVPGGRFFYASARDPAPSGLAARANGGEGGPAALAIACGPPPQPTPAMPAASRTHRRNHARRCCAAR